MNSINDLLSKLTAKRCRVCGERIEITHKVLGRFHTHPCACRCMIKEFERPSRNTRSNKHISKAERGRLV